MKVSYTIPIEIRMKVLKIELKKSLLYKNIIFPIWLALIIVFVILKGPGEYQLTSNGFTETVQINFFVEIIAYMAFISTLVLIRRKVLVKKYKTKFISNPDFQEERTIKIIENNYTIKGKSFNLEQPLSVINKISNFEDFYYLETDNKTPFIITKEAEGASDLIQFISSENKINVC